MENPNQTLQNFKHFFDIDMELKQKLSILAPPLSLSGEENFKYADKLYNSLRGIERQLIDIVDTFGFGAEVKRNVQISIKKYRNKIAQTDYSTADLTRLYNECFAMMNEETLDTIRKNIFPYSIIYHDYDAEIQKLINEGAEQYLIDDEIWMKENAVTLATIINQCSSINEMLHAFHNYITYDNDLLKTISTIEQRSNADGYLISLRGEENKIAEQVFQNYDISISSGDVEIIGFDDSKALVMCRDRGHALTIEIEKKNVDEVGIYYFIPKMGEGNSILDYDNIGLKGVISKKGSVFVVGSFVSTTTLASTEVINIVNLVPTDKEMHRQVIYQSEQREYLSEMQQPINNGRSR